MKSFFTTAVLAICATTNLFFDQQTFVLSLNKNTPQNKSLFFYDSSSALLDTFSSNPTCFIGGNTKKLDFNKQEPQTRCNSFPMHSNYILRPKLTDRIEAIPKLKDRIELIPKHLLFLMLFDISVVLILFCKGLKNTNYSIKGK